MATISQAYYGCLAHLFNNLQLSKVSTALRSSPSPCFGTCRTYFLNELVFIRHIGYSNI